MEIEIMILKVRRSKDFFTKDSPYKPKTYNKKTKKKISKEYCRDKGKLFTHTINLPKIINQKLWDKVQIGMLRLQNNTNSNNKIKYDYLLNGIMYCGNCGNSLKINRNKS